MTNKVFICLFVLISLVYLSLRFYRLDSLVIFHTDQAIHLSEAKTILDRHQLPLLGPASSKTFMGRSFFVGPNYYYLLALIGIVSSWNPLVVTSYFIIIDFIFIVFFTIFIRYKFNSVYSLLTFLFLATSPYLVSSSWFFWNPHLLLPLSILVLFFLDHFILTHKLFFLFMASFFWGFAFSCHYSAVFWVLIFLYFLIHSRTIFNIKSIFLLLLGFSLGDLPFLVFEIRHQFYNFKTIFFIYTHSSVGDGLTYYYFIFPLLVFFLFIVLSLFSRIKSKQTTLLLFLFLITLFSWQFSFSNGYHSQDNIKGWNYPDQLRTVNLILAAGCPQNFNVAATMQGDTRFYDFRYLLDLNNCHPNGIDSYPTSKIIYLVAPKSRTPEAETVWEIASFKPFTVSSVTEINSSLNLFRLDHQNYLE
ncbi:MAG: hypothetical protein NTY75_02605 [Candidatus Shapirobacteria bacterium]|nr:hypothetical protein [Candidatus Shapirobacteria bacterium]